MQCPKCHFENEDGAVECHRCGIVFAKYHPHTEAPKPAKPAVEDPELQKELRQEFQCRLLGIPLALLVARAGVAVFPFLVRLLTMLVHETGHAVTAWFCGFSATPGIWFTPVSEERELWVSLVVIGGLAALGAWGWKSDRRYLIAVSVLLFLVHLYCRHLPWARAQALIIFGGDGGALVLGTLLMTSLYVRRDTAVYQNELRWGFVVIGAAAFMDAFHTWSGREEDIPFGVQEGTQTDPSQLVENYGWTIPGMMQTYVRLGELCLVVLAIVYIAGIIRARGSIQA
ncbi:MAG TPA: hypothetical protein VGK48_16980 [Terriglobia bacterium]